MKLLEWVGELAIPMVLLSHVEWVGELANPMDLLSPVGWVGELATSMFPMEWGVGSATSKMVGVEAGHYQHEPFHRSRARTCKLQPQDQPILHAKSLFAARLNSQLAVDSAS